MGGVVVGNMRGMVSEGGELVWLEVKNIGYVYEVFPVPLSVLV